MSLPWLYALQQAYGKDKVTLNFYDFNPSYWCARPFSHWAHPIAQPRPLHSHVSPCPCLSVCPSLLCRVGGRKPKFCRTAGALTLTLSVKLGAPANSKGGKKKKKKASKNEYIAPISEIGM